MLAGAVSVVLDYGIAERWETTVEWTAVTGQPLVARAFKDVLQFREQRQRSKDIAGLVVAL